jgi:hypothetical protein
VLREDRIDEGVLRPDEVEHRAVVRDDVEEEADRLLEHRPAQRAVEAREALAVDGVVLLEAAEIEPVAAELERQSAHAIVLEQAARLGDEHRGNVELAGGGMGEELGVGHA